MKKQKLILLLIPLLMMSYFVNLPRTHATDTSSLIYYLTNMVANTSFNSTIETRYYGHIMGNNTFADLQQAFDSLPCTNQAEAVVVLRWAAILEKYGITNATLMRYALGNETMLANGLPYYQTWGGSQVFHTGHRYLIKAFGYAEQLNDNLTKWNKTVAFDNFRYAINHTTFFEALMITGDNSIVFDNHRYYDEFAETIGTYLEFYKLGITAALDEAVQTWNSVNTQRWDDTYDYFHYNTAGSSASNTEWECAGGVFLEIISQLYYFKRDIGNSSRLITDIINRFIASDWSAPQLTYSGMKYYTVLHKNTGNEERRLQSTVYAWAAILGLYSEYNETIKTTLREMMEGSAGYDPAWKLLFNDIHGLYSDFRFRTSSEGSYDMRGSSMGTDLAFMLGIVPETTTLAIPLEEYCYEYTFNMFDGDLFSINLNTRHVRLSIVQNGTVTFLFNSSVPKTFAQGGVWDLTFSSDWNSIVDTTFVGYLPSNRHYIFQSWSTATIIVPDNYSTIQEAVNVASPGDIVYIRAGTYYEHVVVDQSILLVGEDKSTTKIDGNGIGTVVNVTADNVSVSGFTIQNGEKGLDLNSDGNTITSNMLTSSGAYETDLKTGLEIFPDPPPSPVWLYLYDLMGGNYSEILQITAETPVLKVKVSGHEDVAQLTLGVFYDENFDGIPQLHEFIGVASRDKETSVALFDLPKGQYIIKVQGYDVLGYPGHFDREITRYTGYGLGAHLSSNNTISDNLITGDYTGIYLQSGSNNTVTKNNVTKTFGGITVGDIVNSRFDGNRIFSNDTSGEYTAGISLRASRNVNVTRNVLDLNVFGVDLWNSSQINVEENDLSPHVAWSIGLHASSDNGIVNNSASGSGLDGVRLVFSYGNRVTGNNISNGEHSGILLWYDSDNNTIADNSIRFSGSQGWGHGHGVEVLLSYGNVFRGNSISECNNQGIVAIETSGNNFTGNVIFSNRRGIQIRFSAGNRVYHNNVFNNAEEQGLDETGENFWDDAYPSGGNYWGDNTGPDQFRGASQNEVGSDGIFDTLYNVGANQDRYPLTKPYAGPIDIGVSISVSRNIVPHGYNVTITISVKVINYGQQATTFNLILQIPSATYNSTLTLANRSSTTLTFTWNTTDFPKGNYTVAANITQVTGETDTTDNTQTESVIITIAGDVTSVTGEPDSKVDMRDIGVICGNFGTKSSSADWNPNFDINSDGTVNMRDIGIACNNFGKS